jgi:hypothetical protein
MIRVIIALDHGGITDISEWEILGRIDISNDLTESIRTSGKRGDYNAVIYKKRRGIPWKRVRIKSYPRKAYHPWELVRRILNEAAQQNSGKI